MKTVIQRNLDLSKVYTLEGLSYVPIIEGGGTCCDNCGKPISNMARLKSEGRSFHVGLDCMETLLQQSQTVLSWDDQHKFTFIYMAAINKAKATRAKVLKWKKKYENLRVELVEFPDQFGFSFDNPENGKKNPLGWDYGFDNEFKEITLKYMDGLFVRPS